MTGSLDKCEQIISAAAYYRERRGRKVRLPPRPATNEGGHLHGVCKCRSHLEAAS